MKRDWKRFLKDIVKYVLLRRQPDIYNSLIFRHLKDGSLTIDCGAHVGEFTEKMLERGAKVYGFEPNPHAFSVYVEKFGSNPLLTAYQKAVWIESGTLKLYLHQDSDEDEVHWATGSSLLRGKGNVNPDKWVEVETIDLVAFIEDLDRPIDLMKIDIEGAECEVLGKILDSGLHKKIKKILVETHDDKIPELREKTNALRTRIRKEKIRTIHLDWI